MISKNLKLTFRHAVRFKTYTFINVGGLALGLASAIAILHFVSEEFSYDDFHELSDNVYRLNTVTQGPTGIQVQAAATPLLAPTLMTDIPEVEAAVRLRHADDVLVEVGEKKFYENKVFYADSNFFKVLTFPLAKGNPNTALRTLNGAVITTEFAEKYFGSEDPINKTMEVSNILLKITGVTLPAEKSHFKFDILISFETFTPPPGVPVKLTSWYWTSFPTYVRLREGTHATTVQSKFPAFIAKYRTEDDGKKVSYQLQPIEEVYQHSRNILERDGISTKGDYAYTMGMAAIAALILGIACFNFTNLSTALSIYRIKETGIRRVFGSSRIGVFSQFIGEAIVMAVFSLGIGLLILQLAMVNFENFLGTGLSITPAMHLKWFPLYLTLSIFIGFLGGLYPAIFLSSLKPQLALKGKNNLHLGGHRFPIRKAIIVFQFFVTAALIATSLTVKRQMDFLLSKDLGYDKEGVIAFHIPDDQMRKLYPSLRNKLSENAMVRGVSASRDLFDGQQAAADATEVGGPDIEYPINMFRMYPNFIETMGLEVVYGRTFSEQFNDSSSFVLNEAAVKMFGWNKEDVIGKKLHSLGETGEVIGVVKDFHFSSLHSAIAPLMLRIPKSKVELLYVRVAPGNINQILSSIEVSWKELAPHLPFDFVMLDEHIDAMYRQDKRFSQLAYVFCGLSVVLACLGLYSVISFMADARTKEIGIRKVLGASVSRIATLLSGEFMVWVLVAAIIALPLSYYLVSQWLDGFAYRIGVPVDVLMRSVVLSSALAGVTVSFKSVRAARANPIDSIRSE